MVKSEIFSETVRAVCEVTEMTEGELCDSGGALSDLCG